MIQKFVLVGVGLASALTSPVYAQNNVRWSSPSAFTGPKYYMPSGTVIQLRTITQINTKDNKAGDRVYLEVAEPVTFRGQVIVPVGAPVVGEVSRVQRNGHFGKRGEVEIRLRYMQTPSGPVRLSGTGYDEGKSGTAASVATIALVSGLGFLIRGTSGYLEPGTVIEGRLAEALRFQWNGETEALAGIEVQPDGAPAPTPGFLSLER